MTNPYLECINFSTNMTDQDNIRSTKEKWVWVTDPNDCFLAGYVLEETKDYLKVKLDTGEVRN